MNAMFGKSAVTLVAAAVIALWGCNRSEEPAAKITGSTDVIRLVGLLESGSNDSDKADAAEKLGELGPAANAAIPALMRAAKSDDYITLKLNAERALVKIGGEAARQIVRSGDTDLFGILTNMGEPAIPHILRGINTSRGEVSGFLLIHLGMMEKRAESALPELERMAADATNQIMKQMFELAIVQIKEGRAGLDRMQRESGERMAELEKKEEDSDRRIRKLIDEMIRPKLTISMPKADSLMGEVRNANDVVAALAAKLAVTEDAEDKVAALLCLAKVGEKNDALKERVLPTLRKTLESDSGFCKAFAAAMMVKLGEKDRAVPYLTTVLHGKDSDIQSIVLSVISIAESGESLTDRKSLAMLVAVMNDPDMTSEVTVSAALALINSGIHEGITSKAAVLLLSPLTEKRKIGAALACKLGPKARVIEREIKLAYEIETDDDLKDILKVTMLSVRTGASKSESVLDDLDSDNKDVLRNALFEVGKLDRKAREAAMPKLVRLLNKTEGNTRSIVIVALCDAGRDIESAFPTIAATWKYASDNDMKTEMFSVASALGDSGNPKAAPFLVEALKSRHSDVSNAGGVGLRNLGEKASGVIGDLIILAKEEPEKLHDVMLTLPDLGKIRTEEHAEMLAGLMESPDCKDPDYVAYVAGKMCSGSAIAAFARRLESKSTKVKFAALLVFYGIRKNSPECADELKSAARSALGKESDPKLVARMKDFIEESSRKPRE